METRTVRAGFIPLLDCAVLVAAAELGYAGREGLNLQLVKEVSWANIRDKVILGHFDCAQMLAGMPVASALGIGHVKVPVIAPFAFGQGGNAITVSMQLYDQMAEFGPFASTDPMQTGRALKHAIEANKTTGRDPLTFGIVFPFSSHNYELRYWMAASGIDPDRDVRLAVIPPPLMADSLRAGHIQGFCVGEPWSSVAVRERLGHIIVTKFDIWRDSPEKVLGLLPKWAEDNPDTCRALIRALKNAAGWADDPRNHKELAQLLSSERYLNVEADILEASLNGMLQMAPDEPPRRIEGFLKFHGARLNAPSRDHALWLYSQMVRWGQTPYSTDSESIVRNTFRPDILAAALIDDGRNPPLTAPDQGDGAPDLRTVEPEPQSFDGYGFDPSDLVGYIEGFAIKAP